MRASLRIDVSFLQGGRHYDAHFQPTWRSRVRTILERESVVSAAEQTFPCGNAQIGLSLFLERNQAGSKLKMSICGSGMNFDFCLGSGVKTKPDANIKGIMAIAFPLGGAQGTDTTCANHYEGETFGLE